MTLAELTNLIYAAASLITSLGMVWNVIISRKNVKISAGNEAALAVVQQKQVENKADLKDEILAVRHDFHNGGGEAIASKVVAHIKPALEETGKAITEQVAQTAVDVAAALADKVGWDGTDRRTGPPDRRGQP